MIQPCFQCKSTRFIRTHDGSLVCHLGHVVLDYREELEDDQRNVGERHSGVFGQRRTLSKKTKSQRTFQISQNIDEENKKYLKTVDRELQKDFFEIEKEPEELLLKRIIQWILHDQAVFLKEYTHCSALDEIILSLWLSYINILENQKEVYLKLTIKDTLVLCYLGCIYAQYPILMEDILRFVQNGQLQYLDALRTSPKRYCEKLSKNSLERLSVTILPSVTRLSQQIILIGKLLHDKAKFNVLMIDLKLYLYRFVRDMNLPNYLFILCADLLKLARLNELFLKEHFSSLPEIWSASLIIYALRLLYDFEGQTGSKCFPRKILNGRQSLPLSDELIANMSLSISHYTHLPWGNQQLKNFPRKKLDKYVRFCNEQLWSNYNIHEEFLIQNSVPQEQIPNNHFKNKFQVNILSQLLCRRPSNFANFQRNYSSTYITFNSIHTHMFPSTFRFVLDTLSAYAGHSKEQLLLLLGRIEQACHQ